MLKPLKLPEVNILSLAVITLLLFIPLYPKFPLFNISGTWVAIRVEDFIVAGVLLLWFLTQIRQGFPTLKNRVSQLIILYWVVGALSLTSALFITKNITPHIALFHFIRRIEYMSLFFVALASVKSLKNVKTYGSVLLLATVGVAIYGIGQKFFGWPVVSTMNVEFSKGMLLQLTEWTRISSTFAGHYDLAAYLVLILAITAGFVVGLKNKLAKITVLIISIFAFYILLLTASRISFAAYLIAITFVLVGLRKYWWVGPILVFSLVGMVFSSDLGQRYALTFNIDLSAISSRIPKKEEARKIVLIPTPTPTIIILEEGKEVASKPTSRVTFRPTEATPEAKIEEWKPTTELAVEYSSGIRFSVEWPRAIRAFVKNPFLGTGYSSVTLATDNDYLRALAETGILGFISFGLIFLEIARRVILYLQKPASNFARAIVVGISGATIGLFANATFIDVFEASKVAFVFWILIGILVSIMKITEKSSQYAKND